MHTPSVSERQTLGSARTLITLDRSARPGSAAPTDILPSPAGPCPFCPGAEDRLSTPQHALYDDTGRRTALAVPNIAPLVGPEVGRHEVVILSGDHDGHLLEPPTAAAAPSCTPGLHLLADRMGQARGAGLAPLVFLNHGTLSGATQPHPHAQILAVAEESPRVTAEKARLAETACALCHPQEDEVVLQTDSLRVIAPTTPHHSRELVVAPRQHDALYDTTAAQQRDELAATFRDLGARMAQVWGPTAYNMLWHQSADPFHWHVHVLPRTYVTSVLEFDWPISVGTGANTAAALRSSHA